jgi:hypothetical protein
MERLNIYFDPMSKPRGGLSLLFLFAAMYKPYIK